MVSGAVRTRTGTPYKPSVVRKYEEQLRTLIVPAIGGVPVGSLTRGDVQRLVDGIAAARTPEHARKALVALRVALRVADATVFWSRERTPAWASARPPIIGSSGRPES